MTAEIPEKSWLPFFEQLKRTYRGAVSIRWIQPGGVIRFVTENMPLLDLIFKKRNNACSDTMTVETGEPGARPQQHQIVEPFCVILRQDEESRRYNELEILAETGKTEITFMPGLDSGLVDKLAA